MNLTVKRCLWSLVAWATTFGFAQAQSDQPVGTAQIGPPTMTGSPEFVPPPAAPPPMMSGIPGQAGVSQSFGITPVDRVFSPRVNIDSRGGGLYGYDAGYSNIGLFVPYKLEDTAILFAHGQGLVTYDGRGGATVGAGWRYWMEGVDRIVGLSAWFDFDNGHSKPYQQVGLSFESLGRYVDYRINGYIPVGDPDHVLATDLTSTAAITGGGIGLLRHNVVEQAYSGFDIETGGPTPILGRYGLNAYIGGYHFMGQGRQGGSFTGVSGRLLSQINEDVSFGVQVTSDHMFGLNTQFQVFMNLPDGRPGRWLRNLRVQDRLVQNVFRQNRVMSKTDRYDSYDAAINPETLRPYFVANINPNLTVNGDGSPLHPFHSVAEYLALAVGQQQQYDFILVQSRTDLSTTNLDTKNTLTLFNGQHLLSTSTGLTISAANLPGVSITLPGSGGASRPMLFNSSGGDVITLAGGNTRSLEVNGFEIIGSPTGSGIHGNNNQALKLNNNDIHGGMNGVLLTNLSGTIAAGHQGIFTNNNIHNNLGNGVQITNVGSPPFTLPLDVVVQGNKFDANAKDGLRLDAFAGSTIGGVIGGANSVATSTTPAVTRSNTFSNNLGHGLELTANGGTLNFLTPVVTIPVVIPLAATTTPTIPPFGIFNNIFSGNGVATAKVGDGLHIYTTNNSIANFNIANNKFGLSTDATSGNNGAGIGLISDSGKTTINIGGTLITNADGTTSSPGNTFNFKNTAIDLAVTGTAILNYNISNNTIQNGASATIAAPHDKFSFLFDGTSGTDPFVITNLSDPGVTITSVTWDLNGTPANIFDLDASGRATIPVIQPLNNTDVATGLLNVNGVPIVRGSNPLLVATNNTVANLAATGITNPKILPLNFNVNTPNTNTFNTNAKFQGATLLEQTGGSSPLTSIATAGSTVTVGFSNGLTASQKLTVDPKISIFAVDAIGEKFGTQTPGFGAGNDGIHVSAAGASTLSTSIIRNNIVNGYGGFGIHVETAGTANASNIIIENNTLKNNGTGINGAGLNIFTGGGIDLSRHDSSTLNALIDNNIVTSNFNNGLTVTADGTAVSGIVVNSHDNDYSGNADNGLNVSISGAALLTLNSIRDNLSGNGLGSAKNTNITGGDNIAFSVDGTAVSTINLHNVVSNLATGDGLSANTSGRSTLNLVIDSPTDPLVTGHSSFSQNSKNGLHFTSNDFSYMHANVYDTNVNQNGLNGVLYNRFGSSLVRSVIMGTSMSNNKVNGLAFRGLGSDAQNPNQPQTGTPNKIILIQDSLDFNGGSGAGQGARFDLLGDFTLVVDANATTFNHNAENGIRIRLTPGAQFGYQLGNERSIFDNVSIDDNGSNGVFLTSELTPTDPNSNNNNLPFDAPSVTFMQISANTGNTSISRNGFTGQANAGLNGIFAQYLGGNHDILVTGDTVHTPGQFGTVIQGNKNDGAHSESGLEANVTMSFDRVLVGGPVAANSNGRNGIDFETQSVLTIIDGNAPVINQFFNGSGIGTLNVANSTIQNNLGHGIQLLGNDLTGDRSQNFLGDRNGVLNANISNSSVINNALNGINIDLRGRMGVVRDPGFFTSGARNTFNITNNIVSNNGQFGIRMEQNAGNQPHVRFDFNDPQPTNPPFPFNPVNIQPSFLTNTGTNTDIRDGRLLSNWLWLQTDNNSKLVLTDNTIQHNGAAGNLRLSDGVFIRVSSDSYLSADIQRNTISGNVSNDLRIESFIQYNPLTGVAQQPLPSVARAAPALDTVFLDHTAQLDLRLIGNVGNTVNIQDPTVNSGLPGGQLQGSSSPNGAFYVGEGLKDNFGNFGFNNPRARLVQLFQVDDGFNIDLTNTFRQNGFTQNLTNEFFNGDYHLRAIADPLFPNAAFPRDFATSPGNPFLP